MAEVVAAVLAGGEATLPESDTSAKLKLLGVEVATFGDAHAVTENALEVLFNEAVAGCTRSWWSPTTPATSRCSALRAHQAGPQPGGRGRVGGAENTENRAVPDIG